MATWFIALFSDEVDGHPEVDDEGDELKDVDVQALVIVVDRFTFVLCYNFHVETTGDKVGISESPKEIELWTPSAHACVGSIRQGDCCGISWDEAGDWATPY